MRVKFVLYEETVSGELLGPPNAIGICQVRVCDEEVQRFHARLTPLDDAAAQMLQGGDRFIARNVDALERRVAGSTGDNPRPVGWVVSDLEMLLAYAQASYKELEAHRCRLRRDRRKYVQEQSRRALFLRVVRSWLKQSRMAAIAIRAGLLEDDARNPLAVLQAARRSLVKMTMQYQAETGKFAPDDVKSVVTVIDNYFMHYAKIDANSIPAPPMNGEP